MDIITRGLYTLLIMVGVFLIFYYLLNQDWFMKFINDIEKKLINYNEIRKANYKKFLKKVVFKEDGRLYKTYSKMLMYCRINLELFFNIKVFLLIATICIMFIVKTTDIVVYTDEMYTRFKYEQKEIYALEYAKIKDDERTEILNLKQKIFKESIALYNEKKFNEDKNNEYTIEANIKQIINDIGNDTSILTDALANEALFKIKKYYEVRQVNMGSNILMALAMFFLPELLVLLYNFFVKVDANKELGFMKRLIIMNGSIKPVDFMEVLKDLIIKSRYYKKILEEIQDKNKKNYLPNTQIYLPYIRKSKSLTEKLFFEKLDEANNYDFDQAIMNIKNEFTLDKRTQARKIKKTVEVIHIFGIVGFMGLIVFVIMYLILPWMSAYDMSNMM